MQDEKLPRLTAEEFWEQWQTHVGDKPVLATFMEFAEAYAAQHNHLAEEYRIHAEHLVKDVNRLIDKVKQRDDLLRRAAELLMRSRQMPKDWDWSGDRSRWFQDAGMEERRLGGGNGNE